MVSVTCKTGNYNQGDMYFLKAKNNNYQALTFQQALPFTMLKISDQCGAENIALEHWPVIPEPQALT